jgi:hypothetical protein
MKDSRIYEGLRRLIGFALFVGVAAASPCQSLRASAPLRSNRETLKLSPVESASASHVREIFDRSSGNRWILQRDETGSAGPGRMVLMTPPRSPMHSGSCRHAPSHKGPERDSITPIPIIHAGERLILEEHTAKIESRLEAVALGQAATGAVLAVRLKVGGKTVKAVAQSPGRAVILRGSESRR